MSLHLKPEADFAHPKILLLSQYPAPFYQRMPEIILPFALVPIVLRAYLKSQGREGRDLE
jgi:hypothetical protein